MRAVSFSPARLIASAVVWSGHGPTILRFTTLSSHLWSAVVLARTNVPVPATIAAWHPCESLPGVSVAVGVTVGVGVWVLVGVAITVLAVVDPTVGVEVVVRAEVGVGDEVLIGVAV